MIKVPLLRKLLPIYELKRCNFPCQILVNMLNILIHFITCSLYFALNTNACVTINFCFALKSITLTSGRNLSIPVHEVLIPNKLNDS